MSLHGPRRQPGAGRLQGARRGVRGSEREHRPQGLCGGRSPYQHFVFAAWSLRSPLFFNTIGKLFLVTLSPRQERVKSGLRLTARGNSGKGPHHVCCLLSQARVPTASDVQHALCPICRECALLAGDHSEAGAAGRRMALLGAGGDAQRGTPPAPCFGLACARAASACAQRPLRRIQLLRVRCRSCVYECEYRVIAVVF